MGRVSYARMPLQATWAGRESTDRIADLRLRCYGTGPADRQKFYDATADGREADGDVLILSDDTGDVATATSLSLTANFRGRRVPCQGVAWVGTLRSHRRRKIDGRGLASRVMDAMAEKARERGQAVSLLAPFRASFYEAFGFGVVERQHTWTIPTEILPTGDTSGFGEYGDADFDAALACRERQFAACHGDVATDAAGLRFWHKGLAKEGFRFVDRHGGRITSQFTLGSTFDEEQGTATVHKPYWDSPAAFRRTLALLGTLKDQYTFVRLTLPADLPVNWLLTEHQVPHRRVDHPAARCKLITRMQGRVVDTPATVAALLPRQQSASVLTVGVRCRSGTAETWRIEVADGAATAHENLGRAGFGARRGGLGGGGVRRSRTGHGGDAGRHRRPPAGRAAAFSRPGRRARTVLP